MAGSAKKIIPFPEIENSGQLESFRETEEYERFLRLALLINQGRRNKSTLFWLTKRAIDITFSLGAIIVLSPILFVCAVMIRIESSGPIFFRQERVGERLRIFRVFKFRTMHVGVPDHPVGVIDDLTGKLRRPTPDEDPRVTRFGRFLRRWSLDELPQVFNILKGEMTIVGPRPLTIKESLAIPDDAWVRYSVPMGLTGIAQLENRSAIMEASRFTGDIRYVATMSLGLDLVLILRTLTKIKQDH